MMAMTLAAVIGADLLVSDPALDKAVSAVHSSILKEFPKVTPEHLGISIGRIDRAKGSVSVGHFQGKQPFYPASTVKLYYLAYGAVLLEQGKLKLTTELERGFRDMIVDSTNDATALVLDAITGTTGGPELSPSELAKWIDKRNAVNRWLKTQGFEGINVNQKTWNEGPYGRERQGYGPNFEYRNSLTPESGVRMMALIALEKLVPKSRNDWMKGLLSRKTPADSKEADLQSRDFVGSAMPTGTKLWSKAGYTSTVRMDIAWFQLTNGEEWIFSIFTKGQSGDVKLLPAVARQLLLAVNPSTRLSG